MRSLGADEVGITYVDHKKLFIELSHFLQFIDYTKEPLHQYLTSHPPVPKFHAIIDAVALTDPSLYAHSPAYLAPSGTFISTGPLPHSAKWSEVSMWLQTVVETMLRPRWLGGTDRKYRRVCIL